MLNCRFLRSPCPTSGLEKESCVLSDILGGLVFLLEVFLVVVVGLGVLGRLGAASAVEESGRVGHRRPQPWIGANILSITNIFCKICNI